jgi:hypothetical protein
MYMASWSHGVMESQFSISVLVLGWVSYIKEKISFEYTNVHINVHIASFRLSSSLVKH